jgi:hypothetical protein
MTGGEYIMKLDANIQEMTNTVVALIDQAEAETLKSTTNSHARFCVQVMALKAKILLLEIALKR